MIGDVREVARAITRASEGVQGYQSTAEAPQSSKSTRRRSLDDDAIEENGRRSPAWPDRLKSSNFRPALTPDLGAGCDRRVERHGGTIRELFAVRGIRVDNGGGRTDKCACPTCQRSQHGL
jgi:hypothetical protein